MAIDWVCVYVCLGIIVAIWLLSHWLIKANPKYRTTKAYLQPPTWLCPVCWNISVLAMTVSMYSAWKSADTSAPVVIVLYTVHFVTVLLWAYYNFQKVDFETAIHIMGLAILTLGFIIAYLLYTAVLYAVYALLLYFLWLLFCTLVLSRLIDKLRTQST